MISQCSWVVKGCEKPWFIRVCYNPCGGANIPRVYSSGVLLPSNRVSVQNSQGRTVVLT